MEIHGYFTRKGLNLSAKLSAGASLTITRIVAGSGVITDVKAAVSLPQPKQELEVNTPEQTGNTATIPVTLMAAEAAENYSLTVLGVYAKDPDAGEILYKVYKLDGPVSIVAGSRMVLRFYLEETVSEEAGVETPGSPAGVITEEVFNPVREAVQKTATPTRGVTVPAAELPAYLKALPRLLTEQLTIHTEGTVTEPLELTGFYGSGSITITADTLGNCTVTDVVSASNCAVPVILDKLAFEDSGKAADTFYKAVVAGVNMRNFTLEACSLTGNGTGRAFLVTNSRGRLHQCTITGFENAVCSWTYSIVGVDGITASGNSIGAHLYWGGIMILCDNTPQLLGGASNSNFGGLLICNSAVV